ncbi:TniB protein [Cytobacillus oceanisediminis]|uniref:TniB protein n=1 Tax=Cytobacillus oceanisediminis TaxID=665099 RepID=A0A2V3A6N7_9BACI|nr:TniB family NTP-binding protein [Cytobacillus oceanisediminis]PWW30563.1 TniB protein [Cytobacillus oceanisediminis]
MNEMIDKNVIQELSIDEKMAKIKNIKIVHPRFQQGLDRIRKCHLSLESSPDPQCMLVTGPSGSGKSTLFNIYAQMYDKLIYDSTRTKKVILWGEIPSPTRINTFLEMMLEMLGDPYPTRGTIGNKNHRLVNLIKDCRVELIMLDEFQHFVSSVNKKVNNDVAECFKSLVNRTNVPVVLFGLEESELVINENVQLKRRFSMRHPISPFSYDNPKKVEEFRMLLNHIDQMLPFNEFSGLRHENIADRMMYATNGLMNSIMKIIREAALIAVNENREKIELKDLSDAYLLHSAILKGKKENPFVEEKFIYPHQDVKRKK